MGADLGENYDNEIKVAPINMLIVQIYAPCEDDKEEEKDRFYEIGSSHRGV